MPDLEYEACKFESLFQLGNFQTNRVCVAWSPSEDSDQRAHSHRLIGISTGHILDRFLYAYNGSYNEDSDQTVQMHLSNRRVHMSEGTFSDVATPITNQTQHCLISVKCINPVSILYKSIAGRSRPVSYPDGPRTARYRFIKNASWEVDRLAFKLYVMYGASQQTYNSQERRYNIAAMLQRRCNGVLVTLCVCWDGRKTKHILFISTGSKKGTCPNFTI